MSNVPHVGVLYLVRHGQASFGTQSYDRLSPLGHEQSRLVGSRLLAQAVEPDYLVTGAMRRQQETLNHAAQQAGWSLNVTTHEGWNEYNAASLVRMSPVQDARSSQDSRVFQTVLEHGLDRWASGKHDTDYPESYTQFCARVDEAFDDALSHTGSGHTAVVVTSSGAIARVATRLVSGSYPQWLAFNRVTINSAITTIVAGRSGATMVSFNDHAHLDSARTTYR